MAGNILLFYINRFHPVLHLHTKLGKKKNTAVKYSPITGKLRWFDGEETRRAELGGDGFGFFVGWFFFFFLRSWDWEDLQPSSHPTETPVLQRCLL